MDGIRKKKETNILTLAPGSELPQLEDIFSNMATTMEEEVRADGIYYSYYFQSHSPTGTTICTFIMESLPSFSTRMCFSKEISFECGLVLSEYLQTMYRSPK